MILKIIYILVVLLNVFFLVVGIKKKLSNKWFNLLAVVIMIVMYFLIDWKNLP
jgi:hypothetical protein